MSTINNFNSRAKFDAWSSLGSMERSTAMSKYVENLEKIIETMNFSPDVENFMEAVGPFYEDVIEEEDEDIVKKKSSSSHVTERIIDTIISTVTEEEEDEEPSVTAMIGRYDISDSSLTDATEDSEFLNDNAEDLKKAYEESRRGTSLSGLVDIKDNNNCPHSLFDQLQKTRRSLQEARAEAEAIQGKVSAQIFHPNIEPVSSANLSQRDIDRMLGNMDGFVPVVDVGGEVTREDSDSDDVFEDSVETISPGSDSIEVISPEKENQHFNVEARIYDPTSSSSKTPSSSPPAAPCHRPRLRSSSIKDDDHDAEDDDEILVVTTDNNCDDDSSLSDALDYHFALIVDKMNKDIECLEARVESVEMVVRDDNKRKFLWWPFQDLNPSTVFFMITWPLLSNGLMHLALAAFKRYRPR